MSKIKHIHSVLFADDSNLFLSCKNIDHIQQMINDELKYIVTWLRANKLSLNIRKTHYMLFSIKEVIQPSATIDINGEPITCVTKTKFLGVIINNKLTWKEHISYICGKVAKGIGIISKVRKYLNKDTLLDLYYSFIYPYLTYCNQVWGLSSQSYMDALVKLQKELSELFQVFTQEHKLIHYSQNLSCSNVMKLTNTWLVDSCIGYIMRT